MVVFPAYNQGNPPVNKRLLTMNDTNEQSEINNITCEGFSCSTSATSKIAVKVGTTGTILLSLCDSCKSRFSSHEATGVQSEVTSNDYL
jgi:hypothetical protein